MPHLRITPQKLPEMRNRKFIIAGGGTGGHIFPALAIANAIRELEPGT
jgi:UDP-N-acetylglucosamine--N-acetylmuramyl-(pentapeptide) pyrophosphoryl-undecaprenol N-acetylglucosamine transferase